MGYTPGWSWHGKCDILLGVTHEVYDAEAAGLLGGLKEALNSAISRAVKGIHICLDNLSVAYNAGQVANGSSQNTFKQFRDLAKAWNQTGKRMSIQWIPGHTGIEGNEIADREAKKYLKLAPTSMANQTQTLNNSRSRLKRSKDNAWQLEWQSGSFSGATQTYKELGLSPTTRANTLKELSLKREILGWLIAARSEHGHFVAYHERFGHEEETDLHCTCGQKRAQLHPFSCPNARAHRSLLWCKKTRRHLGPEEILGTPEGVLFFAEWAPATGLFKRRN